MRAIGQILACPKCGSMVQIQPPPGWTPPSPESLSTQFTDSGISSGSTIQFKLPVKPPAAPATPQSSAAQTGAAPSISGSFAGPKLRAASAKPNVAAQPNASAQPNIAAPDVIPPGTAPREIAPARELAAATAASAQGAPLTSEIATAEMATGEMATGESGMGEVATPNGPSIAARALSGAANRAGAAGNSVARNWIYWLCGPIAAVALLLVGWVVYRSAVPKTEIAAVDPTATPAQPANAAAEPSLEPLSEPTSPDAVPADVPQPDAIMPADIDPVEDDPAVTPEETAAPDEALDPAAENADTTPEEGMNDPAADPAAMDDPTGDATADPEAAMPDDPAPDEETEEGDPAKPPVAAPPAAAAPTVSSPVDVPARLEDPLDKIDCRRVLLADLCDFLTDLSTIPITIDVDALATAGIAVDEPLAVHKSDTTVGELLTSVLDEHGLIYVIEGQQLLITSLAHRAAALTPVKYEVRELADAEGKDANKLAAMIVRFVAPKSWAANGGVGVITIEGTTLVVNQTQAVHRRVSAFVEQLRVARGLKPRIAASDNDGPRSKYARAQERLQKVVTANYGIETPLSEILSWLGRATGTRIMIDGVSVAAAGRTPRSPVTLIADKQTLDEALTALLDPLELTFRVVDEKTLQVFAKKSLPDRAEFEIHPVGVLLTRGIESQRIIDLIREKIDPKSWAAGESVIELDLPSKSLLVLQSPAAQMQLEKMLNKSRAGADGARKAN